MTFSIVATDGTAWGVAVASKFLAVGAAVPAARAGVGAIATQALANLAYRPDGLALLTEGGEAAAVLGALTSADEQREHRQAGIVDATGSAATYTGSACHDWAGGVSGDGYAIQGNILTGADVVAEMERAWLASDPASPLGRRLLAALSAGDAAGGDRRGRQSAALLVVTPDGGYGGGSDVYADLRVMEADIRASTTDWTIVRPPKLTNRPLTGRYRTVVGGTVPRSYSISRADTAHLMLAVLDDPATVGQPIGVGY